MFPPLKAGSSETPASPLRPQSHLPGGGYVGLRPATAGTAPTFHPAVFDITVPDLTGQQVHPVPLHRSPPACVLEGSSLTLSHVTAPRV